MQRHQLAKAQGLFNVASGAWALVHRKSFEAVFGPKADWWLVQTVAGLLVGNGLMQLRSARGEGSLEQARRVGIATASTLLAIDLGYGATGRIRPTYLADVPVELGWIVLWLRSPRSSGPRPRAPLSTAPTSNH
ncbi:hypothetical protein [Sinomonas humi]|uniref:hypothetical protein n=1 Tax=Sinomonas humi TaxID=1338436 RepID=UPI0006917D51|nr:hypothetical protein [Sinomonas humi]